MGNSIWKSLAVMLTVGSLMTLGFAMTSMYGRPDMLLEMRTPELAAYNFVSSGGDNPQWTVTNRDDGSQLGSFATPEAAVTRARADLTTKLNARRQELVTKKETIDAQITAFEAMQVEDSEAVKRRAEFLTSYAAAKDAANLQQSQQIVATSRRSIEIRNEAARRRRDIQRLQNELEEVRTDLYRLRQLRRDLMAESVVLDIENHSLERRKDTLKNPNLVTPFESGDASAGTE